MTSFHCVERDAKIFIVSWIEYFHLELTYNDYPVQQLDQFRDDQKLHHVVKGILQMLLKHWQPEGFDHLSRNPVPVFDHILGEEMFPNEAFAWTWRLAKPLFT